MSELRNKFSWSASRRKLFKDCARAYYYSYYASWGGWEEGAPEEVRLAYRLKKMSSLDMWAGEVVHGVIRQVLEKARAGIATEPEQAREEARRRLNRGWQESRGREWERIPSRRVNLFEHYYGRPIPLERIDALRARVFGCLDRFFASEVMPAIRSAPPSAWLLLEELQSFDVGGVEVFAKPDFGLRRGDATILLYDWKTGRPSADDRFQLKCYALFARGRYGAAPGDIRIVLGYLRDGTFREEAVTEADLTSAREEIAASIDEMRARLRDPAENEAAIEDFPRTKDREKCARCFFWALCRPDRAAERPIAAPSAASTNALDAVKPAAIPARA